MNFKISKTLIVIGGLFLSLTVPTSATTNVSLRGFGSLTVTPRFYSADHSSWITFKAQDSAHAIVCGSKFLADLEGFGDIKPVPGSGLPGTVVALDGSAWWLLGRHGNECEILCAQTKQSLSSLAKTAGASSWAAIPNHAYPEWLDCMDNQTLGFWFLGGGALPNDVNADFSWLGDNRFTTCVTGVYEDRLIAPGILDTSLLDWYGAMAQKDKVPFRMLLQWGRPEQPSSAWNQAPLPYIIPEAGSVCFPDFDSQALQDYDGFFPNPITDPYEHEVRTKIAAHAAENPYFMGHHGSAELHDQTVLEFSTYAGTPSFIDGWHQYLRKTLGLTLSQVGLRYRGDPSAYASWNDISVPTMKQFVGWGDGSVDLTGHWEGHSDSERVGVDKRWFAEGAPADWVDVKSNDVMLLLYSSSNDDVSGYWLRRNVSLNEDQLSRLKYLHISLAAWGGSPVKPSGMAVYLNGQVLKDETIVRPIAPDQDQCLDLGDAAHVGDNTLVIRSRGPLSYIFLSQEGRWAYPSADKHANQLWYDAVDFSADYKLKWVEGNVRATRAGDPNRPIKIMAPWNVMDKIPDLCFKYGAYPHDTGQGAACWGPWMPLYVSWMGIPTSSEPGGPANNPFELQQMMTFYLMLGNSLVDTVFDVSEYSDKPDMNQWIVNHHEMLRCIGKLNRPDSAIAVLRSVRATRLGYQNPWGWDIARGEVQATGRTADYVDLPDFANGRANRFKVIYDDATAVLTGSDVDAIERYVRQGGIFVATNMTGSDSPEAANTWPISRLTGLTVKSPSVQHHDITFSEAETLWPSLKGQSLKADGSALDWMKKDNIGSPLYGSPTGSNVTVIATWNGVSPDQGNVAIASRRIGKGMVLTLGTTFWRSAMDENGHWVSREDLSGHLDEFLSALGVSRVSVVTGGQDINQEVWAEHWRSKNGVYDVYPVARINTDSSKAPVTAQIQLADTGAGTSKVTDMASQGHTVLTTGKVGGTFTLPPTQLAPMECHVYAAPRPDIEHAAMYWLTTQENQWRALAPVSPEATPSTILAKASVLPLVEGWKLALDQTGISWTSSGYDDHSWKTVSLGSYAAMGLPEESIAAFRRVVVVPKAWSVKVVTLKFNAPDWFFGLEPQAKLWVNGESSPLPSVEAGRRGSFAFDVSPEAKLGKITLALAIDGRIGNQFHTWDTRNRQRMAGVTGEFYLEASPPPVKTIALTDGWQAGSDVNVLTPIAPGATATYTYLENKFTLPPAWPARRLYLASSVALGWVILNGHVIRPAGSDTTLDISYLVNRTEENTLRWIPIKFPDMDSPRLTQVYKQPVQDLQLEWLP